MTHPFDLPTLAEASGFRLSAIALAEAHVNQDMVAIKSILGGPVSELLGISFAAAAMFADAAGMLAQHSDLTAMDYLEHARSVELAEAQK